MTTTKIDDVIAKGASRADVEALPTVPYWPVLHRDALYGLAGRLVETIEPHSEADPVALLLTLLVSAGNLIGPGPHVLVEKDVHPARLNVVFVGVTAKARKGLSSSTPGWIMTQVDPGYVATRIKSGLSSGEGVIYNVRDERRELQPVKDHGRVVDYQEVIVDAGEPDKRLLIIEPEFASALKRMHGETNTLSATLRLAWDSGHLSTLTKNHPIRATGAHVSVIGHITQEELLTQLTETERANGFGNRFMFALVHRSKCLPEGKGIPEHLLTPLVTALQQTVTQARSIDAVTRDPAARTLWAAIYPTLSAGHAGMVGALLARSEAQVLRLSLVYALLDAETVIRVPHLKAALALWDYMEASTRRIFGGLLGLGMADIILAALRERPRTETELSALFSRHKSSAEIQAVLSMLEQAGQIRRHVIETGGRPAIRWEFIQDAK